MALPQPPFEGQERREDEEKRPVVPEFLIDFPQGLGEELSSDRVEVFGEFLGGEGCSSGGFGELPKQNQVGGGIVEFEVVLVDQEPRGVLADYLAVLGGRDRDFVVAGSRLLRGYSSSHLVPLGEQLHLTRLPLRVAVLFDLGFVPHVGNRVALGVERGDSEIERFAQ